MARYDPKVLDLGNKELTRLWNIEKDNLQACSSVSRKCIPDLKKFLEEALDEMDPEQQVEERYQSANNEQYQWMASRFLLLNSDQYIVICYFSLHISDQKFRLLPSKTLAQEP